MKKFIYQLAGHPEWLEQIKKGNFKFPQSLTLGERKAVVTAVQNQGGALSYGVEGERGWNGY